MSVDKLQGKIRKLKNPSMVAFCLNKEEIPPSFLATESNVCCAFRLYAKQLLCTLKDIVPAVRFCFNSFSIMGAEGLNVLQELLCFARQQGYYILLDAPEIWSQQASDCMADILMGKDSIWQFDGLLLSCYIGSDGLKPFVSRLKENDKDLFLVLRTANKSAPELQDLLTGSRLVCTAAADIARRLGENLIARCGYSRIAGTGPATSADRLLALRGKYPTMFLLVDGYDYSGANAKNCAGAFDNLGLGAIVCAGSSVLAAWQSEDAVDGDAVAQAVMAAERMKKNLIRYVTIL